MYCMERLLFDFRRFRFSETRCVAKGAGPKTSATWVTPGGQAISTATRNFFALVAYQERTQELTFRLVRSDGRHARIRGLLRVAPRPSPPSSTSASRCLRP